VVVAYPAANSPSQTIDPNRLCGAHGGTMNWNRVVLAGVLSGIATFLADFVLHGVLMADTYKRYTEVFTQTQASPLKFLAVSIALSICIVILFAKTRSVWAEGVKGGLAFGFWFGVAIFFLNFFSPLVIAGFPYFLAWCWGGIGVIDCLVGGAVAGAIVKR
jgi:hypothetical protein